MSRGPAVLATALALALCNLGLASLIVSAVQASSFVPVWLASVLLAVGLAAAAAAIYLWRDYLKSVSPRA